jgi:DoxX-like family
MRQDLRKVAVVALRWTVGLVVLMESIRLAFASSQIHAFARAGLPRWIRPLLAGSEIVAAILFLVPFTTIIGSYLLLVVFFFAALVHVLHGQYDVGVLAVYSMAVLVSMAHRNAKTQEVAHDGR